jgi:hypothetical protein
MKINHTLLAAAVMGIAYGVTACNSTPNASDPSSMTKHSCKGQNACRGQGGCKTDAHGCHGQNACKGQGGCHG